METSNPVWRNSYNNIEQSYNETMTVDGAVNKTFALLLITIAATALVWMFPGFTALGFIGAIAGFILALVISFKPNTASYLAPVYALCEGLFLGMLTLAFNAKYPGLPVKAAVGTFGVLGVMLAVYKTGVIKVTDRFRMILTCAIGGIMLIYIVSMVMGFFGKSIGFIEGGGPIGIGFSALVCGIAAFSLLMDFDMIERGAQQGAPKYMEWYGAFATLVTIVWLYIEMLRLFAKLSSSNRE